MAYIYILRCENDDLYVGSTNDINDSGMQAITRNNML